MCCPAGRVLVDRAAMFEARVAVPTVVVLAVPVVSVAVSRKGMAPVALVVDATVAVSWPVPYGMTEGAARVRAPGMVLPRPAMVWMEVPGAGAASSWRMRWFPMSARVRRVAGERAGARGESREATIAGPPSPAK